MAKTISRTAARNGRRPPPFSQVVKYRTERLFLLFALAYALIALRLVYIQAWQHGWYAQKAVKWHSIHIPLLALRGSILTRDGHTLALTIHCASIFASPTRIPERHREEIVQLLSRALGLPADAIREKLETPKKFVWIARNVSIPVALRIRALKIAEIGIKDDETKRIYPSGSLASNLVGFTNVDGHGIEGIEKVFDRSLTGSNGSATTEVDARRKAIGETRVVEREALDGHTVSLSINYALQSAAEKQLDEMAKTYHPIGATCTVIDVHTGEILAMATYPRYDPNKPVGSAADSRRNRPVTDMYEPGSTLKTVTIASGLDSGAITLQSTFHCSGQEQIGKRTIRCVIEPPFHGGHGTVHPIEIIEHSCNIGAAHVGLRMGEATLKSYETRFGMGRKTGIELPGESSGLVPNLGQHWANIRTANVAFGQGIAVTPLQLLTAYAAVANGGTLIRPTILRHSAPVEAHRIIKAEVASEVRGLLKACVLNGTGKPGKIPGYEVGGKTGSAQKVAAGGRGYGTHKFIASFASVLPINAPRIAILASVDEPKGPHWGAVVAAPVVREVARQAVLDLGIPPDAPSDRMDGALRRTWVKEKPR